MSPKPILKRSVTVTDQPQKTNHYHTHHHPNRNHGVHFPPSSSLTCTFSAYSAAAYDRSPIVVSPNNCALPERGCPGRTYTLEESPTQQPHRGISSARDFHPRALAFASSPAINEGPSSYPTLPQLIPDLSSESDESDGFSSVPSASSISYPAFGIHGLAGPPSKHNSEAYTDKDTNRYTVCLDDSNALAFLPYPPSPPSKYQYPETIDPFMQSSRRRRNARERKHESSSDPDRIPSSGGSDTQQCASAFSSLSISSSSLSPTSPKKKTMKRKLASSSSSSSSSSPQTYPPTPNYQSSFGSLDDGCLGGF